jgi:CMP-N-acetylneuraminic acid synthetase
MNILTVIPARGGSKGIPRKNLRLLNGKPLIYYAITNALRSRHITDVYISSDDDEILYLAETFGAKVHKRDPKMADDQTTLDPVIYDTFDYAQKREKKYYDIVVTMQQTRPPQCLSGMPSGDAKQRPCRLSAGVYGKVCRCEHRQHNA